MSKRPLIAVLNGVNFNMLGQRDPFQYGTQSLTELERTVSEQAERQGVDVEFFQSNHEGEYVEHLHGLRNRVDGAITNPGAWSHYSWAIHDALEIAAVPTVEVHLSDISEREEWRRHSVISDVCIATISGKGVDGYEQALALLVAQIQGNA